jgi:NAD+ diphosphatase
VRRRLIAVPGGPISFAGARLDRAGERRRDEAWLRAQREHPAARAVVVGDDGVRVTRGDPPRVALVPLGDAGGHGVPAADARGVGSPATDARGLGAGEPLLLGLDETGPVFAVDADPGSGALIGAHGETGDTLGLRSAAALLPPADGGLAAFAAALVNWHRRHPHCARCGAATDVAAGGMTRRCPACGAEHFPRTDPVVIMLVTDGDERVLLGRQPAWPPGRYSALAGFVEPGETLEEAVVREVREEARVEVGPPAYVASQPWPFPASLMLGFMAPWLSGEPDHTHDELDDARWFGRAELAAAAAGESPYHLPPPYAIARRLIACWLG